MTALMGLTSPGRRVTIATTLAPGPPGAPAISPARTPVPVAVGHGPRSPMVPPLPEAPGFEHLVVETPGLRTHVAAVGDGEPVVLLHGFPEHWWQWHDIAPTVAAAGYRALCPDLRGAGWTVADDPRIERETRLHDVLALLDALGIERAHLVAHDMGVITAVQLSYDHRRRPRRRRRPRARLVRARRLTDAASVSALASPGRCRAAPAARPRPAATPRAAPSTPRCRATTRRRAAARAAAPPRGGRRGARSRRASEC